MSRTTPPHVHTDQVSRTEELTILIATADAGTATTFALWLEGEFDHVATATNPAAVRDHLDESVGVVLLDGSLATKATFDDIVNQGIDRRIAVIGDETDAPASYVDEYLSPPLGRLDLAEAARDLHRKAQYDRCVAALYELASERADVVTDGGEVEPRLEELEGRIESIRQTTDRTVEHFDDQDFKTLLRGTTGH